MEDYYAGAPWLQQAQDGVAAFIQQCFDQLGQSAPPIANAQPLSNGAQYHERARTAQEIKESIAAEERGVSRAPKHFKTEDPVEVVDERGELADPVSPPATQQRKIIVPKNPGEWSI